MTTRLAGAACLAVALAVLRPQAGVAAPPGLQFAGIVGDARGKGIDIVHVAVADGGRILVLMRSGRIAVFGPDGAYARSIRVPGGASWTGYLAVRGRRILVGDYRTDFPWVFEDRRQGELPGMFRNPGPVVADDERIYVSDAGNKRIQVFLRRADAIPESPVRVLSLETRPGPMALSGSRLLVADDQRNVFVYELVDGEYRRSSTFTIRSGAVSVAMGTDQSVYVAYRRGPDHALREYTRDGEQWSESRVIAPSLYDLWPSVYLHSVPLVKGPDNEIWFGSDTHGVILSLDPETDRVTEHLRGVHRPAALGFGADGSIYVAGFRPPDREGPSIRHFASNGTDLGVFGPSPFYGGDVPIWELLPDRDGGVYVRIIEDGYRKGWPAFTLKKIYADGTVKPFLDLGSLFAVRTRFHPASSTGNLMFDHDGNIVLAAAPHVSLMKLTPAGEVLWEASQYPRHADEVPFEAPVDVAVDSGNNIWVADAARNVIVCVSSEGKHLLTYGGFAGVDDVEGRGFNRPSGIAVVTAGDREVLVVGDSGNHRFVKFRLMH